MKRKIAPASILLLSILSLAASALAQPRFYPDQNKTLPSKSEVASSDFSTQSDHILNLGVFTVDNSNREEVRAFFNAIYWASEYATIDWTGSYSPFPGEGIRTLEEMSPLAGDTSELFKEAVLLRINFYRAMAGIPADIVLIDDLNRIAQLTAIIMGGNDNISHTPISSGFLNYLTLEGGGDDRFENGGNFSGGGENSNLAIGSYGPDSVNGYMQDKGGSNVFVGHRRWILYPPAIEMGTGDTPGSAIPPEAQANIPGNTGEVRGANALHVLSDNNFPPFSPFPDIDFPYVAFPQEGYVPYHVVHPRWSFAIDGANFGSSTVTMTRNGASIPVALEPYGTGFGSNTLVWVYDGLDASNSHTHEKPVSDVTYQVTVSGIQGASQTSYTYDVIVFDPEVPTSGETTVTSITGPDAPEVGTSNSYDVELPAFAQLESNTNVSGIRFRSFTTSSEDFSDDAESGIGSLIADTNGDYNIIKPSVGVGGSSSFHLATGELNTSNSLTIPDAFAIGENSSLSFESKVRTATETQLSKANISLDNGVSWINVFLQPGNNSAEGSFSTKTIDLSAYAGRTIHVQFEFDHIRGTTAFIPQSPSDSFVGWLFDDVTLTNVESMSSITTSDFLPDATSFEFTPSAIGDVSLQAQGMLHDFYELEWGTVLSVSAVAAVENVIANDDTNSIDEGDSSVTGSVLANDDKPVGESLTVDQVNGDTGSVGARIATAYGHITLSSNGNYTYEIDNTNSAVIALNDGESIEDSVTYRAVDSQTRNDTGTLRIAINGLSVSTMDDEDTINEGSGYIKGSVTDNDNAPEGETLTVDQMNGDTEKVGTRIKTDYGYIVIAEDGSYAYQVDNSDPDVVNLNDGETLEETFTYQVKDSQGNLDTGILSIEIAGATLVADPTDFSQVVNISTRSEILTGDSAMIAGFTVLGSDPLDVLIMSEGPTLAAPPNNLSGAIENPTIELFKTDFGIKPPVSNSVDIPQNPNTVWGGSTELSDAMTLLRGRALPIDSNDAAMRATLSEGVYTLIVKGVDDGTGIGTVEVYDESYRTNPESDAILFNIATRSFVGSGQNSVMIAGFTVIGSKSQKVLIRAQGPGVGLPAGASALPNPKIKVFDQTTGADLLFENDNWGDIENNTAEILLVAASVNSRGYVTGSLNSAMVVDLPPNKIYGVHLSGDVGESGIALVEVFASSDL